MNRPYRSVAAVAVRSCSLAILATLAICLLGQAAEEPARAKPVLEFLFGGNLADTSGSKRAGTARGAVAFVDGRQGQCASFDGRGWVDTGCPQKDLGDEFTVECWVNPGPGQSQHADVFGNHVAEGLGFVLQQDGANTNEFLAAYGAGAGKWVTTEAVPLAAVAAISANRTPHLGRAADNGGTGRRCREQRLPRRLQHRVGSSRGVESADRE